MFRKHNLTDLVPTTLSWESIEFYCCLENSSKLLYSIVCWTDWKAHPTKITLSFTFSFINRWSLWKSSPVWSNQESHWTHFIWDFIVGFPRLGQYLTSLWSALAANKMLRCYFYHFTVVVSSVYHRHWMRFSSTWAISPVQWNCTMN